MARTKPEMALTPIELSTTASPWVAPGTGKGFTLVELPAMSEGKRPAFTLVELPVVSDAKRAAFTLVELLVVVTIIATLLALLAPALDKAVEAAERAKCGANLHAWGLAIPQYYFDNRRKILAVTNLRKGVSRGILPNHARWRHTTTEEAGDFNLDDIAPYVQGANDGPWNSATYVGEMWYCPSNKSAFWYRNTADTQARVIDPNSPLGDPLSFMYNDYAYFGLAGSKYRAQCTKPDLVSNGGLGEGKVLMADTIFRYPTAPTQWWFNHSAEGSSMHEANFNGPTHQGPPPPLGVNKLRADGSVAWQDLDHTAMDPPPLDFASDENAWLSNNTGSTQPEPTAYVNYY